MKRYERPQIEILYLLVERGFEYSSEGDLDGDSTVERGEWD